MRPPIAFIFLAAASHIIPGPFRGYRNDSISVLMTSPDRGRRLMWSDPSSAFLIAALRSSPLIRCAAQSAEISSQVQAATPEQVVAVPATPAPEAVQTLTEVASAATDAISAAVKELDLRLVNIYKAFGQKLVLEGFTLDVVEGEAMVIIGYSGSGKSVAIKHIVGLLEPDAGEVWVDGVEVDMVMRCRFFSRLPLWRPISNTSQTSRHVRGYSWLARSRSRLLHLAIFHQ